MDQTKAIERLRFRANFRRELIDGSERAIEHHKSMIRNYKEQFKQIQREIAAEVSKQPTGAIVSVAIR